MTTTQYKNDLDRLLEDELINTRLFDSLSAAYLLNREAKRNQSSLSAVSNPKTDHDYQSELP